MSTIHHRVARSAILRGFGVALLAVGAQALRHLFLLPRPLPATAGEVTVAALAFVCLSVGAALAALGRHIHDRVVISSRWTPSGFNPGDRVR